VANVRGMKKSPLAPVASVRPIGSLLPFLACLFSVSFCVGCTPDDDDDPVTTLDSAVSVGADASGGGASDASAAADAAGPDAGSTDAAVASDAGGQGSMDAQASMDAASDDAASGSADAAADAAPASDSALDASDPASDAAQDANTSDASSADGGSWPVPGCDESYRFVARSPSGGRYQVPPGDSFVTLTLDAPWNNQQVQAIAFRPIIDNEQVVKRVRFEIASNNEILTHFAAGDDARTVLPDNVGIALPTGADSLMLVLRYINNSGATRSDASGVDVCIVRQSHLRTTRATTTDAFVATPPVIEAHAANVEVTSVCNVNNVQPVYLMSAGAYAHEYAVWTKFTVTKRNGTEIVMHHQAYDFDDRNIFYPLASEVMIEQGDQVTTTCVFTNPSDDDLPLGGGGDISEGLCMNLALYRPAGVLSCTPTP
jgi:hypothetical protein